MSDEVKPSEAWQDVMDYVWELGDVLDEDGKSLRELIQHARAADAQQLADWQQRAERQYDENVALIAKGAEQEQQIAALRADNAEMAAQLMHRTGLEAQLAALTAQPEKPNGDV